MRVNRWTVGRRLVQCGVLALLASPALGLSFFEGTLGAASLLGLQLSDPLATLQVLLLTGSLALPLVTGSGIVLALYGFFGGRSFCGWVCPVHLLTDLADLMPGRRLRARWPLDWKYGALGLALGLTVLLGVPAFETLSPIGIAGRALSFGAAPEFGLLVVIVAAEWLLVRRLWCRSLCPLGGLYALLGRLGPVAVAYDRGRCTRCGVCRRVCFVPEVLAPSLDQGEGRIHSGDCSRCGACVGACPDKALTFGFRNPFSRWRIR